MEAEAEQYMTLWNSKFEARPILPAVGEVFDGIGHTPRRQHRYGDGSDENSANLDHSSPDSKGHEPNPVEDESDEACTYLGLWRKQMASHDEVLASPDIGESDPVDASRSRVSHEDMPIRPGIGPGSYARTFEELLQKTLEGQENAGGSVAHSKATSAEDERRLILLEELHDRCAANDAQKSSDMGEVKLQEGTGFVVDNEERIQLDGKPACKEGSAAISDGVWASSGFGGPCSKKPHNGTDSVTESNADAALFQGNAQAATGCDLPSVQHQERFDRELITLLAGFSKSSKTTGLTEVAGEGDNFIDEITSYPVSSCADSVSLGEKDSYEDESISVYSLDHLQDSLLSDVILLENQHQEDSRQTFPSLVCAEEWVPKEVKLDKVGLTELCNEEVRTKDSTKVAVKFEDILALLKLRARTGSQAPAPISQDDEVCERGSLGSEIVGCCNESNSCPQFQVSEHVKIQVLKSINGKSEQLPYVHVGTNMAVCAQSEHLHLSASTEADSNVLYLSDNNVNGFCLDIDSFPSHAMEEVLYNDAAFVTSEHQDHAHLTHPWHHYHDEYDADASLQQTGRTYEEDGWTAGANKGAVDQGCQVEVPEDGRGCDLETELPLRACLVPLRDLINRPRGDTGSRYFAPDKHKAVLLYKNPLWTDDSCQDLALMMSNCQLQDELKTIPIEYGDSVMHSEVPSQRADRRKGWNVDASVSVKALRMASLLLPDEELEETQQNASEEYDGRPLRKKCKGSLYDETCRFEPSPGNCGRKICKDDSENVDTSWLSQNSLSDGYATEIMVGNAGEGTLEEKVDFLKHETNIFETHSFCRDVMLSDRDRVNDLHEVPEEGVQAHWLHDRSDSVDEFISVVHQGNQGDTAIGGEKKRSSQSGWLFPVNVCIDETEDLATSCVKGACATWTDSVLKSKNLLQSSYAHNKTVLEQSVSPNRDQRSPNTYEKEYSERPDKAEMLNTAACTAMNGYQGSQKGYGRFQLNTNAGRHLRGSATTGIRDGTSCQSSSTVSPKSVMQADYILEVENDFGDIATKNIHPARHKNEEPVGDTEKLLAALELEEFRFLERRVRKDVEGTLAQVADLSSSGDKVPQENCDCKVSLSPDPSLPKVNSTAKQLRQMPYDEPMNMFDNRNNWSEEHQQTKQSQGQDMVPHPGTMDTVTSRACAKQEGIAEFGRDPMPKVVPSYFLPGKSQNGSQSKAGPSPTEGRNVDFLDGDLALQKKAEALEAEILKVQTETRKVQRLVNQSSSERNSTAKPLQEMPYDEPMYKFDDRSTWSEEQQQPKQSQGRDRVPHPDTADMVTSKAWAKQGTSSQCAGDPRSKLVRSYFLPRRSLNGSLSKEGPSPTEGRNADSLDKDMVLQKKVEALEAEILKFQTETRKVQRLAKEHEDKASQLCYEKASWEQNKIADMQKFQAFKDEQMLKVKKHHQMLEKLSQEMLQLPTKKERNQIEDLKAALSDMKEEHLKKESRWRLTEKRLRGIIDELTAQSRELQEEIKRYEERLHQEWQAKDSVAASKCERGTSIDYNILSISMREMSHYVSTECTSYHQATGVKVSGEVFGARHEKPYISNSRIGTSADLSTKEASQSKGGRRIGTMAVTEEGYTVHPTGMTVHKASSHNCIASDHDLSGKGMDHARTTQNNEPSKYSNIAGRQSPSGPNTMQLESGELGRSASKSQPLGSSKGVQQNGRNLETLAGSAAISSRGNADDGQYDISSNLERSSVALDSTQDEKHVSVDDCVYFANGDIKNNLPDGSIEYYYSEVDTWHTTKPNGVEIFYFPDYQVEEHWPNGQKKIISPDGSFYVMGHDKGSVPC